MAEQANKILLVEPEPEILEILVSSLTRRFGSHLTCVADAESCLDIELVDPHHLVIAELELGESDRLGLASKLLALSNRPVILLADDPTYGDAVRAMRLGVTDLLHKPFPVAKLLDSAERAMEAFERERRRAVRYRRMRELVRRVVRERRDLNRRMELICRDLVSAHRGLVHRVIALDTSSSKKAKPAPSI